MKHKACSFYIIIVFILISCNRNKTSLNYDTLLLQNSLERSKVEASIFIDSLNYIFLETNDSSLLMQIRNVLIIKDRIVIHDRSLNKVAIFNARGRFLSLIQAGKAGKGFPTEIQNIAKFGDDQILILDNQTMQLGFYDLNGNLLRKMLISERPIGLFTFDNYIGLYRSFIKLGKEYLVKIIDSNGAKLASFPIDNNNNIFKHEMQDPIKYFTFYDCP